MWEFRNRNTFGSTAFTTYGAFWLSLAAFVVLDLFGKVPKDVNVAHALGWFLLAFAIFNTYMLLWSMTVNRAVFLVFLTLEVTEILLFLGFFAGQAAGDGLVMVGGWVGVLTALVAWYASAAGGGQRHGRAAGRPGRPADLDHADRERPRRQPDATDRGHRRTLPSPLTPAASPDPPQRRSTNRR